MAQADEDDFFGIKQLESKPLPEFYHRSNATTQSAPVNVKSKQPKLDPFEENFFPELAERYEQENVEEDMAADQAEEVGFFEEHFTRKGNPEQLTEQRILDQFRLNHDESTVDIFEQLPETQKRGGITELWSKIDPVWKMESEELIDFMAERVIHENDDFIALDKPFQMIYASGPSDQAQLDRILHNLKKRIAPHIDRLHLVNSLEKWCSGVLLFAKNTSAKEQMKSQLNDDNFIFRFRCLVKNIPKVDKARISIPLIKVKQNQDIKLCPLFGRASSKEQLYHLNTDWKLVNSCSQGQVSLLDAFSRRGNAQVVRSHLYYGLDCPLVGDQKYVRADLAPESKLNNKLNPWAMDALNLSNNSLRRMPVFMHLAEVHVPNGGGVAAADNFSVVRAQLPTFYSFALKKLSLLRR